MTGPDLAAAASGPDPAAAAPGAGPANAAPGAGPATAAPGAGSADAAPGAGSADAAPGAEAASHPALDLDDAVHQKTRLALLTVLDEAGRADFPYLRRTLALTDGNLGRHLDVLAQQGFVELVKGYQGRRPRTWATITPQGRQALAAEMRVLAELLRRFHGAGSGPTT